MSSVAEGAVEAYDSYARWSILGTDAVIVYTAIGVMVALGEASAVVSVMSWEWPLTVYVMS